MAHAAFRLLDASGQPIGEHVSRTRITRTSADLEWTCFSMAEMMAIGFEGARCVGDGHVLGMNAGTLDVAMDVYREANWQPIKLASEGLFWRPSGVSMPRRFSGVGFFVLLHIDVEKTRQLLGYDVDVPPMATFRDPALARIVRLLHAEVKGDARSGPAYAEALVSAILARLSSAYGRPRAQPGISTLSPDLLDRVKTRIDETLEERITVEDLAASVHLSAAHFAREFKRATGESPHAYVMNRRLERARDHLLRGESIGNTAAQTGFADQAHLSRLFKVRFGTTPSAYRRQRRA